MFPPRCEDGKSYGSNLHDIGLHKTFLFKEGGLTSADKEMITQRVPTVSVPNTHVDAEFHSELIF